MSTITDTAELAALRAEVRTLKSANASLTGELERLQDLRENDPLRLTSVQEAIKAIGYGSETREQQSEAVEMIFHCWRMKREWDAKVAAAAENLGHAGLSELTELDWLNAFKHGQSEALCLLGRLLRATDESEVDAALAAHNEPAVN